VKLETIRIKIKKFIAHTNFIEEYTSKHLSKKINRENHWDSPTYKRGMEQSVWIKKSAIRFAHMQTTGTIDQPIDLEMGEITPPFADDPRLDPEEPHLSYEERRHRIMNNFNFYEKSGFALSNFVEHWRKVRVESFLDFIRFDRNFAELTFFMRTHNRVSRKLLTDFYLRGLGPQLEQHLFAHWEVRPRLLPQDMYEPTSLIKRLEAVTTFFHEANIPHQPFPPLPTKPFYRPNIPTDDRFRVLGDTLHLEYSDRALSAIWPSLSGLEVRRAILSFRQHVIGQELFFHAGGIQPARRATPNVAFDYDDFPPLELQVPEERDYGI
jgi:hypothetical protein